MIASLQPPNKCRDGADIHTYIHTINHRSDQRRTKLFFAPADQREGAPPSSQKVFNSVSVRRVAQKLAGGGIPHPPYHTNTKNQACQLGGHSSTTYHFKITFAKAVSYTAVGMYLVQSSSEQNKTTTPEHAAAMKIHKYEVHTHSNAYSSISLSHSTIFGAFSVPLPALEYVHAHTDHIYMRIIYICVCVSALTIY